MEKLFTMEHMCLLNDRLARLPGRQCVQSAVAVGDLPSSNRIATADTWKTAFLLAASAMKIRHMCLTVPWLGFFQI
jgi:hypothetical protein